MRYENLREVFPESVTEIELRKIVNGIARIHKLTEEMVMPSKNEHQDEQVEKLEGRIHIDWSSLEIMPILVQGPIVTQLTQEEIEVIKKIDETAAPIVKISKNHACLKEAVVHGVLGLTHARFLPNGEVYFFDFADRGRVPVVMELAVLILEFSELAPEEYENKKRIILDEYQKVNPLGTKDLELLEPKIISRLLSTIMYLCYRSAVENNSEYVHYFRSRIEKLRRFLKE